MHELSSVYGIKRLYFQILSPSCSHERGKHIMSWVNWKRKSHRCSLCFCFFGSHEWRFYAWSDCSKSCDTGEQTREVGCFDVASRLRVNADFCRNQSQPITRRQCNPQLCGERKLRYVNKKWSEVSECWWLVCAFCWGARILKNKLEHSMTNNFITFPSTLLSSTWGWLNGVALIIKCNMVMWTKNFGLSS